MILVIDNYDSFTWNLVHYLMELGADVEVVRNDALSVGPAISSGAQGFLISPGPCTPREAGISNDVIREIGPKLPVLGVCLGHQCIGHVFGGNVVRAPRLMHGKTSPILHDDNGVFAGVPSPFDATRYHSLIIDPPSVPAVLEVNARTAEGEIMGVRHREFPIHGVQFHPESILTRHGKDLLRSFLRISEEFNRLQPARV